jgi:hypothetical protein
MRCLSCGMAKRNTIHTNKSQFGYHEYQDTPEQPCVKSLEERIEELEKRVRVVENSLYGEE